jgi:hypothetical protein
MTFTPDEIKLLTKCLNDSYTKLSNEFTEAVEVAPSLVAEFLTGLYQDRMNLITQLSVKVNTPDPAAPVPPVATPPIAPAAGMPVAPVS